eukprot:g6823.t1
MDVSSESLRPPDTTYTSLCNHGAGVGDGCGGSGCGTGGCDEFTDILRALLHTAGGQRDFGPVLNPKKRAGANVSGTGDEPPDFSALATQRLAVKAAEAEKVAAAQASAPPARKTLTPEKAVRVSAEKQALMKSKVFYPLPSVDAFQWRTSSRGVVGKSARGGATNVGGTSFGNRVAVMPENPSKPGDSVANHAPAGGKSETTLDAYSSSLVKDIIFGGQGQQLELSPAAADSAKDPVVRGDGRF